MNIEKMRAEFESDYAFCGMDFARSETHPEYYASPYANGAWDGWQASRSALVTENERLERVISEARYLLDEQAEALYQRRHKIGQLENDNESLRKSVEFSIGAFRRISSGDGSGHADLARAAMRIAGAAISSPENP